MKVKREKLGAAASPTAGNKETPAESSTNDSRDSSRATAGKKRTGSEVTVQTPIPCHYVSGTGEGQGGESWCVETAPATANVNRLTWMCKTHRLRTYKANYKHRREERERRRQQLQQTSPGSASSVAGGGESGEVKYASAGAGSAGQQAGGRAEVSCGGGGGDRLGGAAVDTAGLITTVRNRKMMEVLGGSVEVMAYVEHQQEELRRRHLARVARAARGQALQGVASARREVASHTSATSTSPAQQPASPPSNG